MQNTMRICGFSGGTLMFLLIFDDCDEIRGLRQASVT